MNQTVQPLAAEELEPLMALFLRCFAEDPYYHSISQGSPNRCSALQESFRKAIAFCTRSGGAFGIHDEAGNLAAFTLVLDYFSVQQEDPELFCTIFGGDAVGAQPHQKDLHDRIIQEGAPLCYLLSLGVAPHLRGQGLGRFLVDFVLEHYPHHRIVGDVSNEGSLPIYYARDFQVEKIAPDYFYICHCPGSGVEDLSFAGGVTLAVPQKDWLRQLLPEYDGTPTCATIPGYDLQADATGVAFVRRAGGSCSGWLYGLNYAQLLQVQRYLNLSCYTERRLFDAAGDLFLIYERICPQKGPPLMNNTLAEMVKTRQAEWSIIPDVEILFPVEYGDEALLRAHQQPATPNAALFLSCLDLRTRYECGVPRGMENHKNPLDFKKRIARLYLGKLELRIVEELSYGNTTTDPEPIGQSALVDCFISIDKDGTGGVFSLVCLSAPFLLSHLLDTSIRNQLHLRSEGGGWCNLYDYLSGSLQVFKRGTPKIFVTAPRDKHCLTDSQLASLLMAETIYTSDEALGQFIDPDILDQVRSEYGMGQYDRGFVCAGTNVLLQFSVGLQTTVPNRLAEEAITFLYLELLQFEEAAIQTANNAVLNLLSEVKRVKTNSFLAQTHEIYRTYTKTIVFWDVQMNYPSSRKSLTMLREAFQIEQQLDRFERNQEKMQLVFDAKRDIMDRLEATALNYIVLFLTMLQVLAFLLPGLFGGGLSSPLRAAACLGITTLVLALYWLFRKLRLGQLMRKNKH